MNKKRTLVIDLCFLLQIPQLQWFTNIRECTTKHNAGRWCSVCSTSRPKNSKGNKYCWLKLYVFKNRLCCNLSDRKKTETFIPNFRTPNVLFILNCLNIWSNYGNVVRELGLKPYLAHNSQIYKLSRYLTIWDFYLHLVLFLNFAFKIVYMELCKRTCLCPYHSTTTLCCK